MWIGVQSAVAGSGFVQVGEVLTKANGQRGFGALFWSDTALHFRPQILWPVAPGDLIVTRIRRAGPIWDVSADDVTAGYPYRIRVRASPQVRDDVAEWVLEDPPDSLSATSDGPFPALSDVRFTRLQFNDRPPRLTRSNGQILMSSDDGVFVPTPALADGFQMSRPHGFVARYLALADVADRALARFDDAWAHWQTLAPGAKRAAALAVARSYRASGRALAALPWPARLRHLSWLMRRRNARLSHAYVAWAAAGCPPSGATDARLMVALRQGRPLTDEMRAALGLPPAG